MVDELIARAQRGDNEAFRQLVEAYSDVAWRTGRVLLRDRQMAEDAVQEAWLDLWRSFERFSLDRPFRPWLLTLVANRCRMAARRRTLPTVPLLAEDSPLLVGAEDVSDVAVRSETEAELRAALATLPVEQQCVLELRFFAELELAEIAAITNVPLGTVKSRLHRALNAVRSSLRPEGTLVREGER